MKQGIRMINGIQVAPEFLAENIPELLFITKLLINWNYSRGYSCIQAGEITATDM